jgi:RNA-binding protein YhbY
MVPKARKHQIHKPTIFISHKHVNREIATKLNTFLSSHSLGKVSIFQSSEVRGSEGLRLGEKLTSELEEKLCTSDVVLLIYTIESCII